MSSSTSSSSRRTPKNKSQDPLQPESPLSDRSPRQREPVSKKKSASGSAVLSPKTPLPLPNSSEAPKHPRRYSTEKVTDFRLEEVHRPTDRRVHVDLEEIENDTRGGTPNSSLSLPAADGTMLLNDSHVSLASPGGPRTSTPKKSSRKSRRAPESLYKKVLMKSTSRTGGIPPAVNNRVADSSMDSYRTAQESMLNSSAGSSLSPIRIEAPDGYRSANSTQRALFSQQGAAPLARRSRSFTRSSRSPASAPVMCQLVTPLAVHTSQEVNAVSITGQILVISQTLVRSALASSDVRKLMNHLAGKKPLISNEMSQVDIDHDNEQTKHEVFVGSDAILIQRISTIHRGRDRNSFETDDRRTYRFICQGDLLPEDRRDKQSKPRHLTIVAESATVKDCEEIEKSERVVLIFDAADKPSRVLAPMPPETSLTHANDLASRPSALKDSPVTFEEHVRVSDHSHINIVRKAHVSSSARLWDEPLTELKEQRVYKQQLADATDCEPVRITRSHSMSRGPTRDRSLSASRRGQTPSRVERGRTPGRDTRNSTVLRPLTLSPLAYERRRLPVAQPQPDCTPSAPLPTDLLTCISPIKDEPARREEMPRRYTFDIDNTIDDSPSLPTRSSPDPKTLLQRTLRVSPSPSPIRPLRTARSCSRSPAKRQQSPTTPRSSQKQTPRTPSKQTPRTPSKQTPVITTDDEQRLRSTMRTPSPASQQRRPLTPLRTARMQSPRSPTRPATIVDEDTSAGSSQSPTQNRTPTTVSPRRSRLTTAVYQSPATTTSTPRRRRQSPSRDTSMDEWERMLDTTQPISPVAAAIARRIPDDFIPAAAPASDSRLARVSQPFRSLRAPHESRPRPSAAARPLGPAKSCCNLDTVGRPVQQVQLQPAAAPLHPVRRAVSEHSLLQSLQPLAAPTNSAIALAPPFRQQQYVRPAAAAAPAAPAAPAAAPVPRPRTTRPGSSSGPVALSASGSATRVRPTAAAAAPSGPTAVASTSASPAPVLYAEFKMPRTVVGKQPTGPGAPTQKNVTLVQNPEDYDEGEILKKKLTLEAKINGHLWNLSVTFALKADRADLIRFAPKRVRIDDQTLWEETENWSQTSLTPVTGPRTVARGSTSYDQDVQLLPGSSTASTQTPLSMDQTTVRVATKNIATASTASSASRSKSTDKPARKRSNSKSGEKKTDNNTPFI